MTFDLVNTPLSKGVTRLEASAGTGKTFALAGLFLRLLLEEKIPASDILVVTFTEAAMFRVKATLIALGFPKNFKGKVDTTTLVGKSAKLVVDIQAGNGVDPETGEAYPARNRIKKLSLLS